MASLYFIHPDGRKIGPITQRNLAELYESGRINDATLVRSRRDSAWKPYKAFASPSSVGNPDDRYYCAEKNGTVAGPFSWSALTKLFESGLISEETPIASENCSGWLSYGAVAASRQLKAAPTRAETDGISKRETTEARYTYLDNQGVKRGPFSLTTIAGLHREGMISDDTALIPDGLRDVFSYAQVVQGQQHKSPHTTASSPLPRLVSASAATRPDGGMEPGARKVLIVIGPLAVVIGVPSAVLLSNATTSPLPEASDSAFSSDSVPSHESVAAARNFVVGTWSGADNIGGGIVLWDKLVIRPNGTYDSYLAHPTDTGWGKKLISGSWTVGTAKYSDTGQHYYYLELHWSTVGSQYAIDGGGSYVAQYPIANGGIQEIADGGAEAFLRRGDNFPY